MNRYEKAKLKQEYYEVLEKLTTEDLTTMRDTSEDKLVIEMANFILRDRAKKINSNPEVKAAHEEWKQAIRDFEQATKDWRIFIANKRSILDNLKAKLVDKN